MCVSWYMRGLVNFKDCLFVVDPLVQHMICFIWSLVLDEIEKGSCRASGCVDYWLIGWESMCVA